MRRFSGLLLLVALCCLSVPAGFSQQRETAAQERQEERREAQARQHSRASADIQADMVRARQELNAAKGLIYKAGDEWGGHRMNALKHVDEAIAEIDKAEAYARAHHFVK
jgi:hypothetical protein